MQKILYRNLNKNDLPTVKRLINESFGIHRYIHNRAVLNSCLNAYLQSCLAEATFSCIAEKDGITIGVIMGRAYKDHQFASHLKPLLAFGYHTLCMNLHALHTGTPMHDYKQMHRIYHRLSANCPQKFDGVLTLFAITAECRGAGVGKALLQHLIAYQKEHGVLNSYLYTDSSCNIGFYEHQGFVRLGEKRIKITRDGVKKDFDVYLYGYKTQ